MAASSDETIVEMQEGSTETAEESAEGSDTCDNYYCEKCKSSFKTQCDIHGPPVFALDHPTRVGTPQRALLTLPTDLVVGQSRAKKGCLGVFNLGQVVPVGMHFGPYDGEGVSEEEALKSVYSWVICKGKDCYRFIDATRDTHSNWMRFVTCSRDSREQNLVAYQQGGRLLFRCCAPIRPGQELLVWYAEDYARGLGLTWDQLWDHKCSTNTDTGSSQVLSCPYCRFTFPSKSYLQRHVRRSHTEQYQTFLETHCTESEEEERPINLDTCLLGSDVPPSVQMEPNACTVKQGSESLIGQASCQSGTPEQHSHQSDGTRCWNSMSESDWSQDTSSVSPSNENGHSCSQCGRSFARAYHLKRHEEAVHSPDKMYCWGRGHRSQRKPPNPRRHRQSPEKEVEEEEVEEREEADGKRVQSVREDHSCIQCSIDFNTQQGLQEHIEQHHSQGQVSNSEGERSDVAVLLGKLSSAVQLSEVADFVDPSDPLYEPPSCKPRMRRAGLRMPAQKRGRGRPRTRPITLAMPKRKRLQKIQRDNGEPRPPDQMQIGGQCEEEVLANGDDVATSLGSSAQTPPEPDAQTGTQLTCAECQRMFVDLATLQSHECVQEGEGLYSCPQCSLHFSQASNLRRHQRSVHSLVKPYCCFPCGKFYTQASGLRRHQEGRQHKKRRGLAGVKGNADSSTVTPAIGAITSIFSCTYCQFSFTAQRYLHKHVKRHHPTEFVQTMDGDREGLGEGESVRMPQSCPQCDKTFVSIKGFKSHRCFRHGEKVFLCPVCSKSFTSLYSLQQHHRVHTGEKPYTCPHCAKCFAVGGQLNVHLRTHTGERPYLCAQCGEGFRQSGDLKRHEQKHLGVRPHQCPQCSKSFSRPQSLRAHLQTHSGQRLFHCTKCNKAFTRGYHLTRHHHKMHS